MRHLTIELKELNQYLMQMGGLVVSAIHLDVWSLIEPNRELAAEADVLAVQTMARAGFDPNALVRYVERVQDAPTPDPAKSSPLPLPEERVADMTREATTVRPSPQDSGASATSRMNPTGGGAVLHPRMLRARNDAANVCVPAQFDHS